MSSGLQRWGQVPCPIGFETYCSDDSMALVPLSKNQVSTGLISSLPVALNADKGLSESNKMLSEEIERLRAEVISTLFSVSELKLIII